jgi:purine catabolism regulator
MVTVGSVLAVPTLGLRGVHICRPDADIRWVATSELIDPTPFLEGGEILLTTGIETREWDQEWDEYVGRLAAAAVAAVGLGIGLTHEHTPDALITACREHAVNLFEVPRRTTFVGISRFVADALSEQETAAAQTVLRTQRRLISAATRRDPTGAVVAALAQAIDGAACLMAPDGRVLTGPVGPRRAEFPVDEAAADVRRLQTHGLRSAAAQSRPALSLSVQPIGLRGRPSTYLATMGPVRLSEGERDAVTTAVAVLGLVDEQRRSRTTTRQRLHSRAIELLTGNDPRTAQLILEVDAPALAIPTQIRFLRASGTESEIGDAIATLEQRGILAAGYADELCAITVPEQAEHAGEALVTTGLQVGIGAAVASHDGASGYRTAGLALAQATPTAALVVWDRVVNNGPLGLFDAERAAAFAESWLHGLSPEQLETLRCFLRHHGSHIKVAEELGLHRNTVRNRLDAIEALLPGQLDDPQTRVSAWIALQSLPS